jgi:hypothetical protein
VVLGVKLNKPGEGELGTFHLDPPAKLRMQTDGTVWLLLPKGVTVPAGKQAVLSLSGAQALAAKSRTTTYQLMHPGYSNSQCYDKVRKACQKTGAPAAFQACQKKETQPSGSITMVKGADSWGAASVCVFRGIVQLASQKNYANPKQTPEGGALSRVALLPMAAKACFPMRTMQFTGHLVTGGTVNIKLEPQGVLRIFHKRPAVSVNLDGLWWNPDILSQFSTQGRSTTQLFPKPSKTLTNAKLGSYTQRKGLIKDAYLYKPNKANKCGCWVQKRLICERKWDGSFKCDQMKRLVRKFLMGGWKRGQMGGSKPPNLEACRFDDQKDDCLELCKNKLLAL